MSDVLEVPRGQTKVEGRGGQREICAHFWCVQMCEAVEQLASLEGPRGPSGSVQVLPHRSGPTQLPLANNFSVSNVMQLSFFPIIKSFFLFDRKTPRHAPSCLLCGFMFSFMFDFSLIF